MVMCAEVTFEVDFKFTASWAEVSSTAMADVLPELFDDDGFAPLTDYCRDQPAEA
jgi:hypothetical protein